MRTMTWIKSYLYMYGSAHSSRKKCHLFFITIGLLFSYSIFISSITYDNNKLKIVHSFSRRVSLIGEEPTYSKIKGVVTRAS